MLIRVVLLAWLLALAAAPRPAQAQDMGGYRTAPDPAWVEMAPLRGEDGPAREGSRYLLVDDQVSLLGAEPVWHRRLVEEVASERGLASAARLSIRYQPLYQRVELHAVELLRDGRRIDRLPRADVQLLRRESDMESGILDGRLTVQLTVPDVRVGDRVEYRFSVIGDNPIFGDDYHDSYSASYGVPLAQRRVGFLHPPGLVLFHQVDRPEYRVATSEGEGWRRLQFEAADLPRVVEEDDTPGSHDASGGVHVSTLPDWPAVARWAAPLYPGRFGDRALADGLVARLRLDAADPEGSLERAIAFVQGEIRYTAIDMGGHSHAPNAPETVIERRFGDCKDKSALLVALLAEAGIEAEPVLVHTVARGSVRGSLPSPLAFDHVIVRARTARGDVWIDATRARERAPLADREPVPFRVGLPVYAGGGLVEIPAATASRPVVDVTQRIRLDADGDRARALFGVVTDYRRGDAEDVRGNFESSTSADIGERYLSYMDGFYDDIAAHGEPSATDGPEAGSLRTVEGYRLDWSMEEDGRGFGIVLFQLTDWMPRLKREARSMPRVVGGPLHARHTIRADVPGGWSIVPEVERVSNPWFSFERRVEVDGRDLVVEGVWRRHADEVAPADYERFRADLAKARDLLVFDVDLGGDDGLPTNPGAWAWPVAAFAALAVLLLLAWRRRRTQAAAGMLFAPRDTMARLLAVEWSWWPALALVLATAVLGTLPEWRAARAQDHGGLLIVGSVLGSLLSFPVFALLLKAGFRALSVRARFEDLLLAAAWGSVPYVLFLLLAGLALGGRVWLLSEGENLATAADMPALVGAVLLLVVGIGWYLVASVCASAAAANTSRGRAAGALVLATLFVGGLVAVVAAVVALAYYSSGAAS